MIVVDASVALSWLLGDEADEFTTISAERLMAESGIVPAIFPVETSNALLIALRRGRLKDRDLRERLDRLADLPIVVDAVRARVEEEVALAIKHRLTVYDSMYLALARRQKCVLITRDKALARAARTESIAVAAPG